MNKQRLLLVAVSIVLPVLLLFVVPPALARFLLRPSFGVATALSMDTGDVAAVAIQVGFSWVLCAVVTAALILILKRTLWPRKTLLVVCAVVMCVAVYVAGRAETNRVYEGTFERGFERSDFYAGGKCWRPPYWLEPTPDIYKNLNTQMAAGALHVKFVGDATAIGRYGHLGRYLRQVRIVRVIETRPAAPCQPQ